jgi:hypothetical protein
MGDGIAGFGVGVWLLSTSKFGDAMNDRIKELAEQAGFDKHHAEHDTRIERFAELVRQDEREANAKLCEGLAREIGNKNYIAVDQRQFCAKQIRARGNHEQD